MYISLKNAALQPMVLYGPYMKKKKKNRVLQECCANSHEGQCLCDGACAFCLSVSI